jgi:hypothetical protein
VAVEGVEQVAVLVFGVLRQAAYLVFGSEVLDDF